MAVLLKNVLVLLKFVSFTEKKNFLKKIKNKITGGPFGNLPKNHYFDHRSHALRAQELILLLNGVEIPIVWPQPAGISRKRDFREKNGIRGPFFELKSRF